MSSIEMEKHDPALSSLSRHSADNNADDHHAAAAHDAVTCATADHEDAAVDINNSNEDEDEDVENAAASEDSTHNPAHRKTTTMMPMTMMMCPNCGSTDIEQPHDASGASICTVCGVVVEENAIVSAVEFVEGAGGSSSMIGQFVSATSSKAYIGGGGGGPGGGGGGGGGVRGGAGRFGFSRDSREATLAQGRRRIQDIAQRLRLHQTLVDAAHRYYTVAVEKNFVQGRRTTHVIAACLYIACRQEKSQHMLIDFSDALQTNVFILGTVFLKFRRLLGIQLEIIDPALYVYRFAAHLQLHDQAPAVALTALRLVARMQRDWITTGRRPAGICAGALLIAARAHGFDQHHSDVTRILRVCGVTVTNRVREFEQTPAAQLSLTQFTAQHQAHDNTNHHNSISHNEHGQDHSMAATCTTATHSKNAHSTTTNTDDPPPPPPLDDLWEREADPPVFQRNRFREARARAIVQGDEDMLLSGALDDPGKTGARARKWRASVSIEPALETQVQLQQLYASIDQELSTMIEGAATTTTDQVELEESHRGEAQASQEDKDGDTTLEQTQPSSNVNDHCTHGTKMAISSISSSYDKEVVALAPALAPPPNPVVAQVQAPTPPPTPPIVLDLSHIPDKWKRVYPKGNTGRALILPEHATEEERQAPTGPVEMRIDLNDWKKDLPREIDDEIETLFVSEEEERQKEVIFNNLNKEYLEQLARKEKDRLAAEAAAQQNEKDHTAQVQGHSQYKWSRRKRGAPLTDDASKSTEAHLLESITTRRISRKINYEALTSIFAEDGSFATDVIDDDDDDGVGATEEDPLFAEM